MGTGCWEGLPVVLQGAVPTSSLTVFSPQELLLRAILVSDPQLMKGFGCQACCECSLAIQQAGSAMAGASREQAGTCINTAGPV